MTDAVQSRPAARRLSAPLRRLGWSEGDAWTVGVGLALAFVLAVTTIPAVLDARDAAGGGAPAPAAVAAPAPAAAGPLTPPPADVPVLPEPVTQPLLGPLAPIAPFTPAPAPAAPAAPRPPAAAAPAPAPLAPGAVRRFSALPSGVAPGAVAAAFDGRVSAAPDAPDTSDPAPSQLFSWNSTGVLQLTSEVPDQPSSRTRGITALGALADGALVATDAATARVLRFDPATRAWAELATLPDLPTCLLPVEMPCQPGIVDTPPLPRGLAVDGAGTLFVADAGQGTIWRLRTGGPLDPWYSSADVAGEQGLAGLAVDGDGHLLAVVTRLGGLQATGAGALLRIERDDGGEAGERTVVTSFRPGDDPVDVAVGTSGSSYVPLRGVHALVVLDASGTESLRVVDDALEAPTSVALADGRALVTSSGPRPAVLAVGAQDRPVVPPADPSREGRAHG